MNITDKAKEALEGATPGPWVKGSRFTKSGVYTNSGELIANTHGSQRTYDREAQIVEQDANQSIITLAPDLARIAIAAQQLEDALEVYAEGCDATETTPCGYEGNLCCQTARKALDRYRKALETANETT